MVGLTVNAKSLSAAVADALRPYVSAGQKVIWREPFRWYDDNGVMSNHYDGMSVDSLAAEFNYEVIEDCGCAAIIKPVAEHSHGGGVSTVAALRRLIADDAYACTFQTFGQYRTALLKAIDAARGMEARSGETEGLDPKGDSPVPSGTRPEEGSASLSKAQGASHE